jgi:hypothetical protein
VFVCTVFGAILLVGSFDKGAYWFPWISLVLHVYSTVRVFETNSLFLFYHLHYLLLSSSPTAAPTAAAAATTTATAALFWKGYDASRSPQHGDAHTEEGPHR